MIQIDEAHHDQGRNEDEVNEKGGREAELENEKGGKEGHHRFNYGIPCRYRGSTISAFPTEQKIAEDRDIIIGLNGNLALRATRGWRDEGCSHRNPEDTHIEKTSHNSPKEEGKDIKKSGVHLTPLSLCHLHMIRRRPRVLISTPAVIIMIIYFSIDFKPFLPCREKGIWSKSGRNR